MDLPAAHHAWQWYHEDLILARILQPSCRVVPLTGRTETIFSLTLSWTQPPPRLFTYKSATGSHAWSANGISAPMMPCPPNGYWQKN